MTETSQPEFWLSGPIPGIPPILQPVAHALMQARREAGQALQDFLPQRYGSNQKEWHLQGFIFAISPGVLDRLFTYARGEQLNGEQLNYLKQEATVDVSVTISDLLKKFNDQVETSLKQLQETDPATLTNARGVGRKQIPSTVIGLLFHAAEHTMRHTGQLLVTAKMLAS